MRLSDELGSRIRGPPDLTSSRIHPDRDAATVGKGANPICGHLSRLKSTIFSGNRGWDLLLSFEHVRDIGKLSTEYTYLAP